MILDSARSGAHKFINSRRTVLALVAMGCCTAIGLLNHVDTTGAIALIVTSIAGANAAQTVLSGRNLSADPQMPTTVGTNTSEQQLTTPKSDV
jgi:hypothetical protein